MEYGPRHRESFVSSSAPAYARYLTKGVVTQTVSFGQVIQNSTSMSFDDVVDENFITRRKQGELFNNPVNRVVKTIVQDLPTWGHGDLKYPVVLWSNHPVYLQDIPDLGYPISDSDNFALLAATRARAKVTSECALLGATLGELRETKNMLASAYYRLKGIFPLVHNYLDIITDPRKNWWDRAGRLVGTARSAWMEVRMGWRPFWGEVMNLQQASQELGLYPKRKTFRAKELYAWEGSDTVDKYISAYRTLQFKRTCSVHVQYSAGELAEQRYGGVPDTYGLTKIPQTIYELTKFSWAVDYFLNIGSLIAAYTPDSLWTPRMSWLTTKTSLVQTVELIDFAPNAYTKLYGGRPRRTTTTEKWNRVPNPPIGFAIKHSADWRKYLDLAGLVDVDFKKLKRRITGLVSRNRRI